MTKQVVDITKIDSAPTEIANGSDENAVREAAVLAHEAEKFKRELGWLGYPFGGRAEKPGNISVIVVLFCFAGMGLLYWRPPTPDSGVSFERVFGGLTSLITLVLGYLFGSNKTGDK